METVDIHKLQQNDDYLIHITNGRGGVIKGFLTQEFSFGGQAEWTSLAEATSNQNTGQQLVNSGIAASNKMIGTDFKAASLRSFVNTVQTFVGTAAIKFQVSLKLIATKSGDNLPKQIREILLPAVFAESQGGALNLMKPPFDYSCDLDRILAGGCSLQVGKWFRCMNFLIINGVTPVFSKELIENGTPLYADVSVEMSTFRAPTFTEVNGWFIL